jgi:hypothetical protein
MKPFTAEWLGDGNVLCYHFHQMTPASMDEWLNHVTDVNRGWSASRPLDVLIDLRTQSIIVSGQIFLRMQKAAGNRPELKGRTAILIGNPHAAELASSLLLRLPLGVRQRKVFSDEAAALDWLLKG